MGKIVAWQLAVAVLLNAPAAITSAPNLWGPAAIATYRTSLRVQGVGDVVVQAEAEHGDHARGAVFAIGGVVGTVPQNRGATTDGVDPEPVGPLGIEVVFAPAAPQQTCIAGMAFRVTLHSCQSWANIARVPVRAFRHSRWDCA